jgi:hypothetical protein
LPTRAIIGRDGRIITTPPAGLDCWTLHQSSTNQCC